MGRIDADGIGQRTASALERGLKDVVAVLARELNEVDGGRHAAGKAQPEFLGHSTSKSPTFSVLQWMSQFRVQRPEMSTAQRMRASSMGR